MSEAIKLLSSKLDIAVAAIIASCAPDTGEIIPIIKAYMEVTADITAQINGDSDVLQED